MNCTKAIKYNYIQKLEAGIVYYEGQKTILIMAEVM